MRRCLGIAIGLMIVVALAFTLACAPMATPTPTLTPTTMPTPTNTPAPSPTATPMPIATPTPTPIATPSKAPPAGAQVVPVAREVNVSGIVVGVKEFWLTDRETVVRYWLDCGPSKTLEFTDGPKLSADLGGAQVEVKGTGGTGGKECDPTEIKEVRFGAVPLGTQALTYSYDHFIGTEPGDARLELAIGSYLSKLAPKFGGEVTMGLVAEANGLAYRFTKLSAGIASFSLTYEPANDLARSRPLGGPGGDTMTIEDDRGHAFTNGVQTSGRFRTTPEYTFMEGTLDFKGSIDTSASTWKMQIPDTGRFYKGPWEVRVAVASYVAAIPGLLPPPTPTPTRTAAPPRTPAPSPTIVPGFKWPSRLKDALSWAPLEFADRPIVRFADYQGARAAVGLEDVRGIEAIRQLGPKERLFDGPYGKLPMHEQLRDYTTNLYDQTGLDLFGFDLGLWTDEALDGPMWSGSFMAMQGPADREVMASKLQALEFKEAGYNGVPYYWLYEEPKAGLRYPLRMNGPYLNDIAFVDGGLLVAPTTQAIEALIDVQRGAAPSLADGSPHASIADAIGDGLLGAAFLTQDYVIKHWKHSDPTYALRLDRYLEGENKWGKLSPYTLGLLGYRLAGQDEEIVAAFYYPDPSAAERDAKELKRRWNTFYYDPSGGNQAEMKAVDSCAPFATKAVAVDGGSVLVGSCKAAPKYAGMGGVGLWQGLLMMGELQFMAPDIEALKRVVGQK